MDELVSKMENVLTFGEVSEYEELVRNNNILQNNSYMDNNFVNYLFQKMYLYYTKLNFNESKEGNPGYDSEIDELSRLMMNFIYSEDYSHKIMLMKQFHNKTVLLLEDLQKKYLE